MSHIWALDSHLTRFFCIDVFARNLFCHAQGFLPSPERAMNALSYLACLQSQVLPGNTPPHTLQLLSETPSERRGALENQTIHSLKKKKHSPNPDELFIRLKREHPFASTTHRPHPAHSSPTPPTSLLLWHRQAWHDTAGKETGSL